MPNPTVPELIATITNAVGVIPSATALINGFDALLASAVAAALANGATPEELAPLTELETQLENQVADLAGAVAAHPTPGGEPPVDPASRRR